VQRLDWNSGHELPGLGKAAATHLSHDCALAGDNVAFRHLRKTLISVSQGGTLEVTEGKEDGTSEGASLRRFDGASDGASDGAALLGPSVMLVVVLLVVVELVVVVVFEPFVCVLFVCVVFVCVLFVVVLFVGAVTGASEGVRLLTMEVFVDELFVRLLAGADAGANEGDGLLELEEFVCAFVVSAMIHRAHGSRLNLMLQKI
jgi:hypothetical protein